MFEPGTILAALDPQSTDEKPYPYDRVYVVGQSPVQHTSADPNSPWAAADAIGFILRPAGETFGPVIDVPYGEINRLYEIEEYPTNPITGEPITPENSPRGQPTPEQVFTKVARESKPVQTRPRAPSLQDNNKSPEQVLREQNQPQRGRRKKVTSDGET